MRYNIITIFYMTKATINQTLSVKDPPKVKADILLAATTLYHNLLLAVKGLERKKNKEGGKKIAQESKKAEQFRQVAVQ